MADQDGDRVSALERRMKTLSKLTYALIIALVLQSLGGLVVAVLLGMGLMANGEAIENVQGQVTLLSDVVVPPSP